MPTAKDLSIQLLAQATDIPPMELEFQMKLLLEIFIKFEEGRLVTHIVYQEICHHHIYNYGVWRQCW